MFQRSKQSKAISANIQGVGVCYVPGPVQALQIQKQADIMCALADLTVGEEGEQRLIVNANSRWVYKHQIQRKMHREPTSRDHP